MAVMTATTRQQRGAAQRGAARRGTEPNRVERRNRRCSKRFARQKSSW